MQLKYLSPVSTALLFGVSIAQAGGLGLIVNPITIAIQGDPLTQQISLGQVASIFACSSTCQVLGTNGAVFDGYLNASGGSLYINASASALWNDGDFLRAAVYYDAPAVQTYFTQLVAEAQFDDQLFITDTTPDGTVPNSGFSNLGYVTVTLTVEGNVTPNSYGIAGFNSFVGPDPEDPDSLPDNLQSSQIVYSGTTTVTDTFGVNILDSGDFLL